MGPNTIPEHFEHPALTVDVEIFGICDDRVTRKIHLDARATCCTTTWSFLGATDKDSGLAAGEIACNCPNPDHVAAVHLQISTVGSHDQDEITFCVLNDEAPFAVMTGSEPCFEPQFKGDTIAPSVAVRVPTKGK